MPALGAFLDSITARVTGSDPDEARRQCEWLTSRIVGCPRLELAARRNQALSEIQHRQIEAGAARLAAGEPLQYILGDTEFMGHVFACDRRALIPRPETEQLAAWVLDDVILWQNKAPVIADVGAGSGCIVVSLALKRPQGRYLATDISVAALTLAQENAARHSVAGRICFLAGDLLSAIWPQPAGQHSATCWHVVEAGSVIPASLDAVVSNPPYVSIADWAQLDRNVRDFEPRVALDGGADGLAIVRQLMTQALQALKPGGVFFLEIGADQGTAALELLRAAGFVDGQLRSDLAGKDRMVRAVKKSKRA